MIEWPMVQLLSKGFVDSAAPTKGRRAWRADFDGFVVNLTMHWDAQLVHDWLVSQPEAVGDLDTVARFIDTLEMLPVDGIWFRVGWERGAHCAWVPGTFKTWSDALHAVRNAIARVHPFNSTKAREHLT